MPTIHTISLQLKDRSLRGCLSDIAEVMRRPLDDLPLVTSISDGVALLRPTRRGGRFCFRIDDDPSVVVAWHSFGRAALIYTLRRRRLAEINMILLGDAGDDAAAIERARMGMGLSNREVDQLVQATRPTVVQMSHDADAGIAGLLGFGCFAPMMCEAHEVP